MSLGRSSRQCGLAERRKNDGSSGLGGSVLDVDFAIRRSRSGFWRVSRPNAHGTGFPDLDLRRVHRHGFQKELPSDTTEFEGGASRARRPRRKRRRQWGRRRAVAFGLRRQLLPHLLARSKAMKQDQKTKLTCDSGSKFPCRHRLVRRLRGDAISGIGNPGSLPFSRAAGSSGGRTFQGIGDSRGPPLQPR